ncbi:unnamed protein product [Rotaria sp. Silwood1]|nr:unnamed protein product [Rotaria sp. Silwood1]
MISIKRRNQRSRFSCWHPLLPAFEAKIIFAVRALIGIGSCAAFTLSPATSSAIQGQLLLSVGLIVSLQSTLGATIQTGVRLCLAGAIATAYCLPIVNFLDRNVYNAIATTTLLVLLIVYTDLPAHVRRFTIVPTCIILLQWYGKSHINTAFVLQIWASLSLGGAFAIVVSCIPILVPPTAYRELTMRMRFIARQTRRETTAIILLISQYHNIHSTNNYTYEINEKTNTNTTDDIEIPTNYFREDDLYHHSSSFEDLKNDHLLKGDIIDLHKLVNDELQQMQRAANEISYEPYFILLKFLNLMRQGLRRISCFTKCITKPSTLQTRLQIWVTGLLSLQRVISGMLTLDNHHSGLIGQRRLIDAVCSLLESTFNFLDATLSYTTSSTTPFNTAYTIACRSKVEQALAHFFETYKQVHENSHYSNISNTKLIQLNTFLLLILRLIHVVLTAAESSETPGARLDTDLDYQSVSLPSPSLKWKKSFEDLVTYIGLVPSYGKIIRAVKTSLSVFVSAVVVIFFRERLQAYGWVYWAPMTTALVSDSSEGSTLRLSFQRLMGVLLGSTYAYIIVLITHNLVMIGVFVSLFVALMAYVKTDPSKSYFASVCAQSASIITFLSNQHDLSASNKATLARTSLTFLGIFIHVIISNLIMPITARALIKKKISVMITGVSEALHAATDDFCSFVDTTNGLSPSTDQASSDLLNTLTETECIVDSFPALLDEALNEPNLWKRPFVEVKDRYNEINNSIRNIIRTIRFVRRCTTILKAESKLHLVQEDNMTEDIVADPQETYNTWTANDLRRLQKDLDIPLTIFKIPGNPHLKSNNLVSDHHHHQLSNSLPSIPIQTSTKNTISYKPVLEHIRTLEKNIQQVLSLVEQLLRNQATVDIGTYPLEKMLREDSFDSQLATCEKRLSFHLLPQYCTAL